MASFENIARPYALAAFDYAREKEQLSAWKTFLETAASISRDPTMVSLLTHLQISSSQLLDLYCDLLKSQLDDEKKNFLLLLAQNRRFSVLPQISTLFNEYYAALEKMSTARVITAVETEKDYQEILIQALTKRTKRKVTLQCEIDPAILGGVIIHMGDSVIDGSVRGKLTRLLKNLTG